MADRYSPENRDKPKIVLTGGHLAPLLAVLDQLDGKAEPVVIGRKYTFENDTAESLECQILTNRHIPFYNLSAPRLQRKFTRNTIPSFFKGPGSFARALSILKREKPVAVLTFGGYIGFPVAAAAKILGIPVVLHEQTLDAGLTNKLIARIAKKICISHESSNRHFPKNKVVLTGNPVRKEIFLVRDKFEVPAGREVLLVMGGSSGAHRLNVLVEDAIQQLLEHYTVIHQTGDAQEFTDYDRLERLRSGLSFTRQKHYILKKFIQPDEIGWAYHNADMVLSRSGMNTVTELLALGKRAVLVPLPFAQKNEQKRNAQLLEQAGLGIIMEEKDMSADLLLKNLEKLKNMKSSHPAKKQDDAAEKIARAILSAI
ncbi:MAG: UDP-N-acetylglucosamine--N-acetylmuramyl-(pentapeptide) pyrophosphoryl-undecaprenol N-acetylglucosamine transferase [Candidatus Levyibacteriota bacterium]